MTSSEQTIGTELKLLEKVGILLLLKLLHYKNGPESSSWSPEFCATIRFSERHFRREKHKQVRLEASAIPPYDDTTATTDGVFLSFVSSAVVRVCTLFISEERELSTPACASATHVEKTSQIAPCLRGTSILSVKYQTCRWMQRRRLKTTSGCRKSLSCMQHNNNSKRSAGGA